jgi:hypothetical protein
MEEDHYTISGSIKSGKNSVEIKGFMAVISKTHELYRKSLKVFLIMIMENLTRKGTKTFASKDGGKTYRLQDMVNGSGFVDYIDIHF